MNISTWMRKNWFLLGLVSALVLGFATPGLGDTLDPGGATTRTIVIALFFIAGFTLPSEQIRRGLTHYRLHLYLQIFVFVVVPLYFFLTARLFTVYLDGILVYGLYALAVLPTTISTCVVFTQATGGNTVGALFNAAFSNIAGIFVSPLLLSLFLAGSTAALPAGEMLGTLHSLVLSMLVPVVAGQVLHVRFRDVAHRTRTVFSNISNALILVIVYTTISGTADNPEFLGMLSQLPVPFAFLAVTHLLLVAAAFYGARVVGFSRGDQICAMYVGPQKTLAMGVPLLTVYFAGNPDILAVALLPLLFYHPFQLLVAGVLRGLPAFRSAPEAGIAS
ncbi:MAG: bile acid:sodium symporter family protein [Spirochaetaceae bacterium]